MIDCVDAEQPNLAIAALKPELGIRAAGVPLKMEVAVTNYGPQTAHEVSVQLAEDRRARPAVTIPSIPPGQTVAANFEVRYQNLGQHSITAKLPADAVAADNARYTVLDFPQFVPVLVIDGDPQGDDQARATLISSRCRSRPPASRRPGSSRKSSRRSYLRDKPLDAFHVIYLLNIDRLDQPEIDALEDYVRGGGGLVFFVGDHTRADFMNSRLYRDGKGLFPVPLVGPTELLVDRAETGQRLAGRSRIIRCSRSWPGSASVDIDRAIIEKYFAVEKHWTPPPSSDDESGRSPAQRRAAGRREEIWRRPRDGLLDHRRSDLEQPGPHAAAHRGDAAIGGLHVGRAANGSQPASRHAAGDRVRSRQILAASEILHADRRRSRRVSGRSRSAEDCDPGWRCVDGSESKGAALKDGAAKDAAAKDSATLNPSGSPPKTDTPSPAGQLVAALPVDTGLSGFYAVELTAPDGHTDTRRFAYNVQSEEGNLKMVDGPQLESRLGGVKYHFHRAADAFFGSDDVERADLSRFVLYLLLALLIGEQMLAYSASYHPKSREVAR